MRVVLLVVLSSATAGMVSCMPAASVTMRRRLAISMVQTSPPVRPETARCHTCRCPVAARAQMVSDPAAVSDCPAISRRRRSSTSASTPVTAPSSSIGMARSTATRETASADCVASQVNTAPTRISTHRMTLATPPTAHRRMKSGFAIRRAMGVLRCGFIGRFHRQPPAPAGDAQAAIPWQHRSNQGGDA